MAVYGNVNVKYAPCKSVAQLHSAADYILGKKKEQLSSSVIKTKSELYNAFGCNRDNFANSVLMTRKMHQKKYSRFFPRDILAQKLSISFHPEDNDKPVSYTHLDSGSYGQYSYNRYSLDNICNQMATKQSNSRTTTGA